jgi:hypothetical protein
VKGIRLVYYLDDIRVLAKTKTILQDQVKKDCRSPITTGVDHQSVEIRHQSEEDPRCPWFHVQHEENEDMCPQVKAGQDSTEESSNSTRPIEANLPEPGRSPRENYVHDTSNRKSFVENSIPSSLLRKEPTQPEVLVGQTMHIRGFQSGIIVSTGHYSRRDYERYA